MEKETKNFLRLVKPTKSISDEELSNIEMKFNRLLVQALCFQKYESYLNLMDSYKIYKQTKDFSILERKIKEFEGLFLYGAPSLYKIDLIRSTLSRIKNNLSSIPEAEESRESLKKITKLLIRAAIKDDRPTIAKLILIINNFKISKDISRLYRDVLDL
jgi:uncharacterized alpha-E superfamily protein